MLEVLPVVLYREVKPFSIWFYLPLLDNDVSLHDLVELFVARSTSQRSSKTESGRKSYGRVGVGWFTGCSLYRGQTISHLVLSLIVEQWCFTSYSCSARRGDSDEPKNIENGVRMQKLLRFSYRPVTSRIWSGNSGFSPTRSDLVRKFRIWSD